MQACVPSPIDAGVLYGPPRLLNKVLKVLNRATRIVTLTPGNSSSRLWELILTYKDIHGLDHSYLTYTDFRQ